MNSTTRENSFFFTAMALLVALIAVISTATSGEFNQTAAAQQLADAFGVPVMLK